MRYQYSQSDSNLLLKTSFLLFGTAKLTVQNLSKNVSINLNPTPMFTFLEGTVTVDMESRIRLCNKFSGFVNIGVPIKNSINWNKMWCTLDSTYLKFWKHPVEDEVNVEPENTIDLKFCSKLFSTFTDSSICARKNSLLLEIVRSEGNESMEEHEKMKYYMSLNTHKDVNEWMSKIKEVLTMEERGKRFQTKTSIENVTEA